MVMEIVMRLTSAQVQMISLMKMVMVLQMVVMIAIIIWKVLHVMMVIQTQRMTCTMLIVIVQAHQLTILAQVFKNLALNKPSTQSSVVFGASAGKANDGNTNGDFLSGSVSATDNELNAWWEVDLGEVYNIETIDLWNRTDNRSDRLSDIMYLFRMCHLLQRI